MNLYIGCLCQHIQAAANVHEEIRIFKSTGTVYTHKYSTEAN